MCNFFPSRRWKTPIKFKKIKQWASICRFAHLCVFFFLWHVKTHKLCGSTNYLWIICVQAKFFLKYSKENATWRLGILTLKCLGAMLQSNQSRNATHFSWH